MSDPAAITDAPLLPRRPEGEEPRQFSHTHDGVTIVGFEWEGEGDPILLCHATGFHARVWDEAVRAMPGRRVIALDLRGHGRSDNPTPPINWRLITDDVVSLVDDLDLKNVVIVGHSRGGYTAAEVVLTRPERFAALILVDPALISREQRKARSVAAAAAAPAAAPGAEAPKRPNFDHIARRRNEWASPDEMVERFASRFPFETWKPQVLRDYATYGLLPAPNGEGFVLACPPEVEAGIYAGGGNKERGDIYPSLKEIKIPVRVLRARPAVPGEHAPQFTRSTVTGELAAQFEHGTDVMLPDLNHFIVMQAPNLTARHIIEVADAVS